MIDDTLPFDELDPCCQKELEDESKRYAVAKRLKKYDRSNVRKNTVQSVFTGFQDYKKCGCCSIKAVDYPLLAQIKRQLENKNTLLINDDSDKCNDESDNDSDDDFMNEMGLNALTPLEEERLKVICIN